MENKKIDAKIYAEPKVILLAHRNALEKTMRENRKVTDAVYKASPEMIMHNLNNVYTNQDVPDIEEKYKKIKEELVAEVKKIVFINSKVKECRNVQLIPIFRNSDNRIKKVEEMNTEEMLLILKKYIEINVKPLTIEEEKRIFETQKK